MVVVKAMATSQSLHHRSQHVSGINHKIPSVMPHLPSYGTLLSFTHHHHQTPWDQRPLVSTARFTRILHPALSTASPANE